MQSDDTEQIHKIKHFHHKNNNRIVSIDNTLSLLEKSSIRYIRGCSSSDPWPAVGFNFLEGSVLSTQLTLHQIEYYTISETSNIIISFETNNKIPRINNQIFIVYDNKLKLNLIFNSTINWNNNQAFTIERVNIINYIDYLIPLTQVTKSTIISTIVARTNSHTQHILESEIVSIGEFRPIYFENKNFWRYYKETKELYRNHIFKHVHQYDLYKSINYRVHKRFILSLNQFVFLEIVIVKPNYFTDIIPFYSGQDQFIITKPIIQEYRIIQPHQFDYLDTLEKIITKYYPQSH